MLGDEIAGQNLFHAPFRGDGLEQTDATRGIGVEQVLIGIGRFCDDLRYGIGYQLFIDGCGVTVQSVQNALNIPGMSVETVVDGIESRPRKFASLRGKEFRGKVVIGSIRSIESVCVLW